VEPDAGTENLHESTITFLNNLAERKRQIRENYQDLIELTMVVFGYPPVKLHWERQDMCIVRKGYPTFYASKIS
jgi:hypothetical protein